MIIKCIVACTNSSGEPDLYFAKVKCTKDQYETGKHYDAIKDEAANEGYMEPFIVYDQNDRAGKFMLSLFVWDSASIHKI